MGGHNSLRRQRKAFNIVLRFDDRMNRMGKARDMRDSTIECFQDPSPYTSHLITGVKHIRSDEMVSCDLSVICSMTIVQR